KAPPESTQKGRTCMSNEYDYSGLYDHTSDGGAPRNSAQDQQPAETGSQNSYPNVGSSGMNTANTARTDYSSAQSGAAGSPAGSSNGYTSSFSGGSGGNGGYNGYSYSSAPQQPAKPPRKGRRTLLRVLACVGVVALGFGGGLGGAIVAARTGLTGGQVVVQQVQRDTSDATNANSTGGESMSLQQISSVV